MKKVFVYLFVVAAISISACKGNSTGKTGGAQADSGATNMGNSGAADTARAAVGAGGPTKTGTSGTDTSSTGNGAATPTVDTVKN